MPTPEKLCSLCWRRYIGYMSRDVSMKSWCVWWVDKAQESFHIFPFLGQVINDEWFSDDLKRMDDDNVYRKMQGHWIIEMSEMMATVNAKSIEDIKSFISRQKETYKIPYETHPEDRPRQCVFVGTSNSMDFLPLDRTGNRRFAPILVHPDRVEKHILEDEKVGKELYHSGMGRGNGAVSKRSA